MRSGRLIRIWASDTGSRLGFQVFQFLLPVTAVAATDATPTEVGLITAVQFLPVLLFSLTAGSLVARYNATSLLLVGNLLRLISVGFLAVTATFGHLTLVDLAAAGFLVGTATIMYDVTFQATLPRVFGPNGIQSINGLLQASISVVQMGAPALAGLLVGELHDSGAFVVVTGSFLLVVLGFATHLPGAGNEVPERVSVIEGLKYTWHDRYIRAICIQSGIFNLHEQAFLTVFLVYGLTGAGFSSGQIGLVIGTSSVGALLGALIAGRVAERLHFGRVVSLSLPIAAVALLSATLLPRQHTLAIFAVAFAVNGIGLGLYNVNAVSLRQITPPVRLLGPVTAAYRMLSFGTIPLGALIGGLLLDHLGGRTSLVTIAASLVLLTSQILFTSVRSLPSLAAVRPAGLEYSGALND